MSRMIGWRQGAPDTRRNVTILRELMDGKRVQWHGFYDGGWYTLDGISIGQILGWRELPVLEPEARGEQ